MTIGNAISKEVEAKQLFNLSPRQRVPMFKQNFNFAYVDESPRVTSSGQKKEEFTAKFEVVPTYICPTREEVVDIFNSRLVDTSDPPTIIPCSDSKRPDEQVRNT
jgi:hypothetical protein